MKCTSKIFLDITTVMLASPVWQGFKWRPKLPEKTLINQCGKPNTINLPYAARCHHVNRSTYFTDLVWLAAAELNRFCSVSHSLQLKACTTDGCMFWCVFGFGNLHSWLLEIISFWCSLCLKMIFDCCSLPSLFCTMHQTINCSINTRLCIQMLHQLFFHLGAILSLCNCSLHYVSR